MPSNRQPTLNWQPKANVLTLTTTLTWSANTSLSTVTFKIKIITNSKTELKEKVEQKAQTSLSLIK